MKAYIITLLILMAWMTSCSQNTLKYEKLLKEKVPNWLIEYDVPVAGIGIIEAGEIKFLKVFGELQKNIPAPENTIFNVASITKTVTTMLTLKLVEAGQWSLDEPLSKYWIDPDIANDTFLNLLTTRHVLTHQTGFLNWRWNHPTYKLTFEFKPGTDFQYSGEGFEYLRNALERKFNKSIEQLSDSLLFKPIGMKDTRHSWDNKTDESRFAEWYDTDGEKYEYSKYLIKKTRANAADDLITTVEDYCKFGIYVMNGAQISAKLFKDMVKPQSNKLEHSAAGLGWFLVTGLPDEEYAIHHSGSDYGVKTMALFLPKSKRGIVVFTNGDNGMSIYNNVIKETFDIGNKIYEYLYERPNIPEIVNVKDEILEKYTGRYQQKDGRINKISKKGNIIIISGGGWSRTILHPESENKFFVREFDNQYEFIKDKTGKVIKMIIYLDGKKYAETKRIK